LVATRASHAAANVGAWYLLAHTVRPVRALQERRGLGARIPDGPSLSWDGERVAGRGHDSVERPSGDGGQLEHAEDRVPAEAINEWLGAHQATQSGHMAASILKSPLHTELSTKKDVANILGH
jgi:hypothetical protein